MPYTQNESVWMIFFDDANRLPELFSGYGAEEAARRRFEQLAGAWSVSLFQRVASR